jgi:hypothetical protein
MTTRVAACVAVRQPRSKRLDFGQPDTSISRPGCCSGYPRLLLGLWERPRQWKTAARLGAFVADVCLLDFDATIHFPREPPSLTPFAPQ